MNKPIILSIHLQASIQEWLKTYVGHGRPFKQKLVAEFALCSSEQIRHVKRGKFNHLGYDGWVRLIQFAQNNGWEADKQ